MATTSTTASLTSSNSPAATTTDSGSNGTPSSTLYLLTFLATLFVLLFVSCAIVLRSFFIRRRFRQQVEEQVAAGILPPEALSPKKDFGEKPKLWDVSIKPDALEESWEYLSPLTARIIHDSSSSPEVSGDESPSSPPRYQRLARRVLWHRQPPDASDSPTSNSQDTSETSSPIFLRDRDLQVAVMVAMPSQRTRRDSIPEMVIGLSQVPVRMPP